MQFEFATASRIVFGQGVVEQVAPMAKRMAERILLVIGKNTQRSENLLNRLRQQGLEVISFQVPGEPTTGLVENGVKLARQAQCQLVIGIGGGSVLDAGKVISALLTNRGDLLDYLEIVGGGHQLTEASAPYIAIPTTAGTGAEVTRNAVLGVPDRKVKVSMRSHHLLPFLALIDPTLTYSMPPSVTASTGLDALTQLIEAFVSSHSNPLTDGVCREGLVRASRSLRRAYKKGGEAAAREDMALASLFSGLALANAKLGAVHGFAGALGGMFSAPHGVICGQLLPWVMEANISALRKRAPDSPCLAKYDASARLLTNNHLCRAEDGIRWIKDLCQELDLPSLGDFGLRAVDFPSVVAKAQRASSMKGNPIVLEDQEMIAILNKVV